MIFLDNQTQFTKVNYKNAFSELEIQHIKVSFAYPQAVGQVEITNKVILHGLKKRQLEPTRNYVGKLQNTLWSLLVTPNASTGENSLRMAYRTEAVLPTEINSKFLRGEKIDPKYFEVGLHLNNDLIEELRDSAQLKVTRYEERVAKLYEFKIKPRDLKTKDLVLREVSAPMPIKIEQNVSPMGRTIQGHQGHQDRYLSPHRA